MTDYKYQVIIARMDKLTEELSVTNTFLFYIFQAQLKQMEIIDSSQYAAFESMMKDNPATKKYVRGE